METLNRIDNGIMKGVNAGVRAWNWTTGRTKKSLSNILMNASLLGVMTGFVDSLGVFGGLAISLPTAYCFIKGQKCFNEAQEKESQAFEDSLKDLEAEEGKE